MHLSLKVSHSFNGCEVKDSSDMSEKNIGGN